MQTEIADREQEARDLKNQLTESQKETEALKAAMLATEEKHRADLATLEEKLTFDCDKRLLQQEKEYQAQLQQVRDEYNQQVKDLLTQLQREPKSGSATARKQQ
jgi:hypothetical protein